jgi:hypothetical protein
MEAHVESDHDLEQLAAEWRYHRDRFQLYRARVMSGSAMATSPARLRQLERTATAAEERLAHARRGNPVPPTSAAPAAPETGT